MIFKYRYDDKNISCVYWEEIDVCKVESLLQETDELQVWYPLSLSEDVYDKYKDCITYIELGGKWGEFTHSIENDLKKTEEEILQEYKKTCRYEVRRAKTKDGLSCELLRTISNDDLREYFDFYNQFAKIKGLPNIQEEKIESLVKKKMFSIARVYDSASNLLSTHGYIEDGISGRVSLCTSSSLYRLNKEEASLISRANRLLHYFCMIEYKRFGYSLYDFGGLYIGDNQVLNNVSEFKKSFGGKIVEYPCGFVIHKSEADQIEKTLESAMSRERKNIVVWGAGWAGRYAVKIVKERYNKTISYWIDNKLSDDDNTYSKERVLDDLDEKDTIIIVAMREQTYRSVLGQDNIKRFRKTESVVPLL